MDKERSNIENCIESIEKKLKITPVLVNKAIRCDRNSMESIDVIQMKKLTWDLNKCKDGLKFDVESINNSSGKNLWQECLELRTSLVGYLADCCEKMEDYVLNDTPVEEIPNIELYQALRKATLERKVAPVLCGSALRNMGVQPLLDAVCHYLPNPTQNIQEFVKYYKDDLCALVFKTSHDKSRGILHYLRIYSGSLSKGSNIYNINQNCNEKIGKLLEIHADEYKELQSIDKGNIVCVSGFKTVSKPIIQWSITFLDICSVTSSFITTK